MVVEARRGAAVLVARKQVLALDAHAPA